MPRYQTRQELETYWRLRVKRTREVYLCASLQHMLMREELRRGQIALADGSFAVAQARRAEALAISELTRTMQVYADLVVKGIVPSADEDEKLIG